MADKYTKSVRLTEETNKELIAAHSKYIIKEKKNPTDNEVILASLKEYNK